MLVFIECALFKTNRSGEEASLAVYLFIRNQREKREKLHPPSTLIAPAVKNEARSSSMRRHFNPSVYIKASNILPSGSTRKNK